MNVKPTPLLLPFAWLYSLGVTARNWLFEKNLLKVRAVEVPVISVGNISAGGTGKTPFVELLARTLRDQGLRPAILSRGYGRKTRGYQVVSNGRQRCAEAFTAGDEPAQMAEKLEGVVVVVDEDRVNGARTLLRDFHPDVIALDDGFQHRRLARDLDIVLVTAEEALSGSRMLPSGYRREPWSSLRRADLIAISKCESVSHFENAARTLTRVVSKRMIGVTVGTLGVRKAGTGAVPSRVDLRGRSVTAVSGIADPLSFEKTLSGLGCITTGHRSNPDHYWYSDDDLKAYAAAFRKSGADMIVTTEKDEARMLGLAGFNEFVAATSCAVVEIGAVVIAGNEILQDLLQSTMNTKGNT